MGRGLVQNWGKMGRSPCCEKAHTSKGAWTKQEDAILIAYIQTHGEGCWRSLPKAAGLSRCGKSCRLRWINYLHPDLKRGNFCEEENELIIKLHALLGNKWSMIASRLPGRTDNEIKNYWNSHIKKKLRDRGIDPQTHGPIASYDRLRSPNKRNQVEMTPFLQNRAQKVVSEECSDVNLELCVSLPSAVCSDPPAKGDLDNDLKEASGATSSLTSDAGNDSREYKAVCCHIGLQISGGRCYRC